MYDAVLIPLRILRSLMRDHEMVTKPNFKDPFQSNEDIVARLLPYHVFSYPDSDLIVDEEKLKQDG